MPKPIIGIDLGTTNCAVTKYEKGRTTVLPIKGKMTTPSVLYFYGDGVKIGHEAKARMVLSPEKCLASTKRDMGTEATYNVPGTSKPVTPVTAASLILKYLKQETEDYLNEVCNDVVITVPAYFGFAAREATRQAAIGAGWNPIALIDEPTAAAMIYGQTRSKNSLFTVIDLGGGTFDVSILQYTHTNGKANFKVLNVDGNDRLGGDDFDNAIVEYMKDQGFSGKDSVLKVEAEKAKIDLSTNDVTEISLGGDETTLTREQYRELIHPYLDEICETIKRAVAGAGKSFDDIDRFILVGGSCKHPVVKETVANFVGRAPFASNNLDTAVSEGAALYHHIHEQVEVSSGITIDIPSPKTLGTDYLDSNGDVANVVLIKKGEEIPRKAAQLAFFAGGTLHTSVLEGDAHLAQDCERLYEMVVDMQHAGTPHAIVTIFEMDESGLLRFITHELSPSVDISPLADAADAEGIFEYTVWEKFQPTVSRDNILTKDHKLSVKE